MSQLQKIIYLTRQQYETLLSNNNTGQITYGGITLTGVQDNNIYFITDETVSATDLGDDFVLPVNKGGTGKTQFTSGSLLVGNGQNALTEIGATDQNTPSTIVKRDGSGNFSAGKATLTEAKIGSISIAANKLTGVTSIDTHDSNGLLAYKPTSWTGVSNVQWGVGTINAQGVIRSSNTDLLHSRSGTNSVILDAGNYASYIKYVNLYEARASTTTLNKTANYVAAGAMFHLVASSSTSATDNGKTPMGDANILQMNWDNNGGYDAQLGIHTSDNRMEFRSRASQKQAWREVVTSTPGTAAGGETQPVYINTSGVATAIPYTIAQSVPADAVFTDHYAWEDITGKPTKITLTGAVTGNVTLGSGENSIATTVNHNHDDRYKIASGVITLGSSTITPVTSVNGHTGDVTISDLGLASALKYVGTKSSLPTATDSTTYSTYNNGDVITVSNKEYAYVKGSNAAGSSWVELGDEGSYKLRQTAFTNSTGTPDESNTSTTFIYSFSQDENGTITNIKTRSLPTATSTTAGIVKVGASDGAAAYSHTHSYLANTNTGAADRPIYITGNAATQTTYRMAGTNTTATTGITYSGDLDTGIWYVNGISGTDKTTLYNQSDGVIIANKYSTSWISEIYQDYRTGQLAIRGKNNGTWAAWRKILDSTNYTDYTVTKTGTGASGTWGINVTGSAGSVAWANTGHPDTFPPTIGTTSSTAMAGNTNVNNVTQTATSSSYTYWRPLLVGDSNGTADTFTVTTKTGATYGVHSIKVQPSSGTIKATTFQGNLTGNVTGDASTVGGHTVGADVPSDAVFTDTTYTFDGTYNASSNKAATVSTVTNAINALDGGTIGTGSATKTITSLSQTNGNVSATFSDITFPVSSVAGLSGAIAASNLTEALGLSKALHFVGITTTDMTGGTATNHTYTGTPAGISDYTPIMGDVVINSTKQDEWVCTAVSGTTYTWERLGSDTSYKIVQSAVSDPTAASTTSTTFIDTISQDANGVISATKKTLPNYAGSDSAGGSANTVKQTPTTGTYYNWRKLLVGTSNNSSDSFTVSSDTSGSVYQVNTISVKPAEGILKASSFIGQFTGTGDLVLKTTTADSPDIVWKYGNTANEQEQARIWMGTGGSTKWAPQYRCYKQDGTQLYNGTLVLGDGTGASGTWAITANAASQLNRLAIQNNTSVNNFISATNNGVFKYTWVNGANAGGDDDSPNPGILNKPKGTNAFGLFTFKTADNWNGQIFVSTNNLPGIYWRIGLITNGSLVANWTRLANGNANIYYGESTTAADTAIKDVTCLHYHTLNVGDILVVKFTNANSANEPQLNVNSTGNKLIRASYSGGIVSLSSVTQIRNTCMFIYDGTYWIQMSTDCVKQMVTTSSESVWRSVMVSASNNASESFTPDQMFAKTYVAHNVKFQASTGTLRATKFKGTEFKLEYEHADKAYMTWNNTDQSIDFIFV